MAFANLERNKSKTTLVVISLALSVVLLNVLVTFTGGFDMEKYPAKQTCGDFIVSSTDYFRSAYSAQNYISENPVHFPRHPRLLRKQRRPAGVPGAGGSA